MEYNPVDLRISSCEYCMHFPNIYYSCIHVGQIGYICRSISINQLTTGIYVFLNLNIKLICLHSSLTT